MPTTTGSSTEPPSWSILADRGMTIFSRIYTEMWQIPAKTGGVLVFDTCKFNRDNFGADEIVDHIASRFPRSSWSVLDQQTWYAAELPEPLPGS